MFDFQVRTYTVIRRLRFLGTWYNVFKIDGYSIYSVALMIYYNLHNLAQVANIFLNYDDMDELTSSTLLTFTEILTNVKAYYVIQNEAKVLKINEMMKEPLFQPRNSIQEEKAKSTFTTFDRMYLLHSMGPTLTIVFLGSYSILEIHKDKKLPFNAWYPYDYKTSPFFELTYFHQLSSALVMAHIHVNSDCLAFNMIATIISQIDFLKDNLRNLGKKSTQEYEDKRPTDFYDCIKHHKYILACYSEVYQMLNINLMAQFVVSTTSLCLTSFQLSMIDALSTRFMALLIYQFAIMVQLLMFCWWGNELSYKSEEIPRAAFESNWIESSLSAKKDLIFFIHCTQKPLVLYAVDLFSISLSSFALIMKNSYSFYAVLRHINNSN